jgi:hypothetical protein
VKLLRLFLLKQRNPENENSARYGRSKVEEKLLTCSSLSKTPHLFVVLAAVKVIGIIINS